MKIWQSFQNKGIPLNKDGTITKWACLTNRNTRNIDFIERKPPILTIIAACFDHNTYHKYITELSENDQTHEII